VTEMHLKAVLFSITIHTVATFVSIDWFISSTWSVIVFADCHIGKVSV